MSKSEIKAEKQREINIDRARHDLQQIGMKHDAAVRLGKGLETLFEDGVRSCLYPDAVILTGWRANTLINIHLSERGVLVDVSNSLSSARAELSAQLVDLDVCRIPLSAKLDRPAAVFLLSKKEESKEVIGLGLVNGGPRLLVTDRGIDSAISMMEKEL